MSIIFLIVIKNCDLKEDGAFVLALWVIFISILIPKFDFNCNMHCKFSITLHYFLHDTHVTYIYFLEKKIDSLSKKNIE